MVEVTGGHRTAREMCKPSSRLMCLRGSTHTTSSKVKGRQVRHQLKRPGSRGVRGFLPSSLALLTPADLHYGRADAIIGVSAPSTPPTWPVRASRTCPDSGGCFTSISSRTHLVARLTPPSCTIERKSSSGGCRSQG